MLFFLSLLMVSFCAPLLSYEKNDEAQTACQCVPPNLCGDDDDTAVNGQGMLDIRMYNKICQNYFDVCCEKPISKPNLPTEPSTYRGCGYQNPIGVIPRITIDSQKAGYAELPWTVIVLLRDVEKTERNMYKCGGSLIHPQVVLTAAHCVFEIDPSLLTVRAGEWNTKSQEEPFPHQDRTVEEILLHPNFNSGSLKNDAGLMFLIEPFTLGINIGIICLPPPHYQVKQGICTASGWGKDTLKKGKHSSILRKVDLPLVSKEKCVDALRKTRLGVFYKLHKSFICAGGESNRDTCKGDGGSPLICPVHGKENRFLQLGIVSWGIGCGEHDIPGVYANVPLFSQWIDDELNARNMETNFYKY